MTSSSRPVRLYRWIAATGVLALAGSLAVAGRARVQDQPPPTFRTGANYVRVDVYPTLDGRPVGDLTQTDFEVLEDGAAQRIDAFEHVVVRGSVPQDQRVEPNTVAQSRDMLSNPRARAFVVFLDIFHVGVEGSYNIRQPLVTALDRLIGPDDLVGVMTPTMAATDVTFARKTTTIEGFLSRRWDWGQRARVNSVDPREDEYKRCYPGMRVNQNDGCGDDRGIADAMIARRREKLTIDALTDLVEHLRDLRDERKAVILVSDGWLMFRPDATLRRRTECEPPRPTVAVDPRTGRLTSNPTQQGRPTDILCETDRVTLAALDSDIQMRRVYDLANRANVSFYPVDPRGLAVWDVDLGTPRTGLPAPGQPIVPPPSVDNAMLRTRQNTLRDLAAATDGLAVMNSNDLSAGFRRITDDLSSYYLLSYYSTGKLDGKFHAIRVRVKRPGVQIRARRGYLAATQADIAAAGATASGTASTATSATGSTGATGATAATAVAAALGELSAAGRTARVLFDVASGWKTDDAGLIWVSGEFGGGPEWASGATVSVVVTPKSGGAQATSGRLQVAPGSRSFRLTVAPSPTTAGERYEVAMRVTPTAAMTGSSEPVVEAREILMTSPSEASGVLFVRRGQSTGNRDLPAVDRRFRRADQIRIEVPDRVSEAPAARLLDRRGQPLPVPVAASVRSDADGSRFVTAQLALGPLAPGDYLLEVTRREGVERTLVAFRVIP